MSPSCVYDDTVLVRRARPYTHGGFYLGRFSFLVCPVCQRVYQPISTASKIEEALRNKGLFPSETRIASNVHGSVVLGQSVEFPSESPFKVFDTRSRAEVTVRSPSREPKRVITVPTQVWTNEALV